MAHFPRQRLPRGINFLLGGSAAAIAFFLFAIFSGSLDLGIGGAPDVRIETISNRN